MSTTTTLITGVDFVCVPTRDHDRAVAFYGETLGLEQRQRWGEMPATEFQAGNLTLAVFDPTGFGQPEMHPNSAPIALRVEDVEAARSELEAKGSSSSSRGWTPGVCHQAIFLDPDGNALILHHRYAPPAA